MPNDGVSLALALAQGGVDFRTRRQGGTCCPLCGKIMETVSSGPRASPRVRRHKCRNETCLLATLHLLVKSVQREQTTRSIS